MSNYLEDENRLKLLATGDERQWKHCYDDMRSPFRLFFMKYAGLDPDAATELYHEAMIILHRNVTHGKLTAPLQSKLKTYLFGIGKLMYRKKGGKTSDWDDQIPEVPVEPLIETHYEQDERVHLVKKLLQKIGEPCRQLLEMVYLKGYVMEAVAKEMDLPSEGSARKRKFDCLKKMRALMADD